MEISGLNLPVGSYLVQTSLDRSTCTLLDSLIVSYKPEVAQKNAQLVPTKCVSDGIAQEFARTQNLDQAGNFEVEHSIYDDGIPHLEISAQGPESSNMVSLVCSHCCCLEVLFRLSRIDAMHISAFPVVALGGLCYNLFACAQTALKSG